MSANTWVISDWHYNHANILNFTDSRTGLRIRPEFSNVKEMNECLLDSHNSVVKDGDTVYNLGDIFFGDKAIFEQDWPKFNGTHRLIVGNHDNIKYLVKGNFFKEVYLERKFREMKLHFSHIPLHQSQHEVGAPGSGNNFVNVHGHIHQNPSPEGRYINVSVEMLNYTPININELAARAAKLLAQTDTKLTAHNIPKQQPIWRI